MAMYLRRITGDRPSAWVEWLPWVEYCCNKSFHSALHATPFEVVYDRPPLPLLLYTTGTARTDKVDVLLRDRNAFLAEVRERLFQAQQLSKKYYGASHRDVVFAVGNWVWMHLHCTTQSLEPRAKVSLALATLGHFRCLSALDRLHIIFSFSRVLSSMWGW
jgi:hypothetical protein